MNLHGISKRGDTYLRMLLIHGARRVLAHAKEHGWEASIPFGQCDDHHISRPPLPDLLDPRPVSQ